MNDKKVTLQEETVRKLLDDFQLMPAARKELFFLLMGYYEGEKAVKGNNDE
jgi:hypothetical protein